VVSGDEVEIGKLAETLQARMASAGEESEDYWFKGAQLDMATVAKVVGFTVLCFFHMRRWKQVVFLSGSFWRGIFWLDRLDG